MCNVGTCICNIFYQCIKGCIYNIFYQYISSPSAMHRNRILIKLQRKYRLIFNFTLWMPNNMTLQHKNYSGIPHFLFIPKKYQWKIENWICSLAASQRFRSFAIHGELCLIGHSCIALRGTRLLCFVSNYLHWWINLASRFLKPLVALWGFSSQGL